MWWAVPTLRYLRFLINYLIFLSNLVAANVLHVSSYQVTVPSNLFSILLLIPGTLSKSCKDVNLCC